MCPLAPTAVSSSCLLFCVCIFCSLNFKEFFQVIRSFYQRGRAPEDASILFCPF